MKDLRTFIIIGIIAAVLIVLALSLERFQVERAAEDKTGRLSVAVYDLVSTIKGDAATSRAFTWYTGDQGADGWLEVEKGEAADFTGDGVIRVQAVHTTIKTDQGTRGVHKAEITGLEPGTLYTYRVGSGEEGEWSLSYEFHTAELDSGQVTFINVTDSQGIVDGDFAIWGNTLEQAFKTFPAAKFTLHNGDLTEEPTDSGAWNSFFGYVQNRVASVPLMPVTGNHEEINGDAELFTSHFNLPDNGAKGSIEGTSYSFDYGPVHVTVLNTESNLKKQADWLKQDLAGTDKPWTIIAMHRPAYGGNMYSKVGDWTEIFDKYNVDLVLQGHNHEYSRSYPLRAGKIVSEGERQTGATGGTVYVVTNASGVKFNEKKEDQFYHKVHFQNNQPMFAGIMVSGDTLTYQAYDTNGKKLDEFVLTH
ncbi:purple acid phosphatase family protein [Paenibacillus sp. FSL R7-0333]|uniref:purple acid phosphatase family protein n=1 Tax=Paenibacillus sp. FSL R7-0333 TaxID=1926587 RepID=UPI00096C28FD|nr:metallophosphoesterase [Paenibacillus sp. FSL R7-0333]